MGPFSLLPCPSLLPLGMLLSLCMMTLLSTPTSMELLMTTVEPTLIRMRAEMDMPPLDPTVETLLRSPTKEFPPMDLLPSRSPTLLLPMPDLLLPMLLPLLPMLPLLLPTLPLLLPMPQLLPMLLLLLPTAPLLLPTPLSSMVKSNAYKPIYFNL